MENGSSEATVFQPGDDTYTLYNFHDENHLSQMMALICSDNAKKPRCVMLSGGVGIGQRYFLEAASYRATMAGQAMILTILDLAGYEPGQGSLEAFANHQLAKYPKANGSLLPHLLEYLQAKVEINVPGILGVSLLSIGLEAQLPAQELVARFRKACDLAGSSRDPRESLHRLLKGFGEERTLVLHVVDSAELSTPLRRWVVDEAKINPHLVLVFSCEPQATNEAVALDLPVTRFEFAPLDEEAIRTRLAQRFSPNSFPVELADALRRYSRGLPGHVAIKVRDMVSDKPGAILQDHNGQWHLPEGGMTSEVCAKQFTATLYEPIDAHLAQCPPATQETLRQFFSLAALCGSNIPIKLLFTCLEVEDEEQDVLIDHLDDHFVGEDTLTVLREYGYAHPSFPNELLYTFANPLLRNVFLDRFQPGERAYWAHRLLRVLKTHLTVPTRGTTRLLLEVARFLASEDEKARYQQELAWWIGSEEAEELAAELSAAVKEGRMQPEVLWGAVTGSEYIWPAYRRLAVLDAFACQEDGVPSPLLIEFYTLRSELLRSLGRFAEAYADAESGLALCKEPSLQAARLHACAGVAKLELAEFVDAESYLGQALTIRETMLGPTHPDVATSLNNLAELYRAQGRYTEAEPYYQRALTICETVLGPTHPDVATVLENYSLLLETIGKKDEAARLAARASTIQGETNS